MSLMYNTSKITPILLKKVHFILLINVIMGFLAELNDFLLVVCGECLFTLSRVIIPLN